ncbi:MAG: transcription termination/antitermination protein NusA [Ruminococcaceae bacterium]|nr:transcription termination/antitermination protein NusA [Oscillospiraceae bacterium]
MNKEFLAALEAVANEKSIDKELLIDAIETALLSAYKREFTQTGEIRGIVNRKTGEMGVYALKKVVEKVEDPSLEISFEEASKINKHYQVGDEIEINVMPKTFGRIAAQTAKQVIVQRIREAERTIACNEFSEKKGEILLGLVQRIEQGPHKNIMIEIGTQEAILAQGEQTPGENIRPGEKIYLYVIDVKDDARGLQIVLSRSHPGLIKRLFEKEVPEIQDGTVEIKGISREAGSRTKIAVFSNNKDVDPVGSCVGPKGMRVSNILNELRGEKIDIIVYNEDPEQYITQALSPAKVLEVSINEEEKSCQVLVPESQLSLAIGKEGQNVRLAAKLTGWKIDIKSVKD